MVDDNAPESTIKKFTARTTVGVDVGLTHFCTLSTGEKVANPRFLKKSLRRLRRLGRQHSRKKKGSNNRNKSRLKLSIQHERVSNQRHDFQHKLSTRLVRENQAVAVETLNITGMARNRRLSQAISDAAWGSFITKLEYKARWSGKTVFKIGRFEPSSRMCTCGRINRTLTLADRVWTCPKCATTHDRDVLAANNIKRFALIPEISKAGSA